MQRLRDSGTTTTTKKKFMGTAHALRYGVFGRQEPSRGALDLCLQGNGSRKFMNFRYLKQCSQHFEISFSKNSCFPKIISGAFSEIRSNSVTEYSTYTCIQQLTIENNQFPRLNNGNNFSLAWLC